MLRNRRVLPQMFEMFFTCRRPCSTGGGFLPGASPRRRAFDAVRQHRRAVEDAGDFPEGRAFFIEPAVELAIGLVGVGGEGFGADEDRALQHEAVAGDVLLLGGNAQERVDEVAEEIFIAAQEHVRRR